MCVLGSDASSCFSAASFSLPRLQARRFVWDVFNCRSVSAFYKMVSGWLERIVFYFAQNSWCLISFVSMAESTGSSPWCGLGEVGYGPQEFAKCRGSDGLNLFLMRLGVDLDRYRTLEGDLGLRQYANFGAVKMSFDLLLVGVRFPVDPFICQFLEKCHARLEDLSPGVAGLLVGFAAVLRCFGFDPSIEFFLRFFRVRVHSATRRITCRPRVGSVRLFHGFYVDEDGWEDRMIFVESREGWSFGPVGVPLVGFAGLGEAWPARMNELREVLCDYLDAEVEPPFVVRAQRYIFNWADCVSGRFYIRSGQAGVNFSTESFRVKVVPSLLHPAWKMHVGRVFPSDCEICQLIPDGSHVGCLDCQCTTWSVVARSAVVSRYVAGLEQMRSSSPRPYRLLFLQ